jgi:hypothetical protein
MKKQLDREALEALLTRYYPRLKQGKGEAFAAWLTGTIWCTNAATTRGGRPLFKQYTTNGYYYQGVLRTLWNLLDEHGWYADFYDAETIFLHAKN